MCNQWWHLCYSNQSQYSDVDGNLLSSFLDPVGSLVSTLWVVGGLLVGCHTFSKLVNFECVGVLGVC